MAPEPNADTSGPVAFSGAVSQGHSRHPSSASQAPQPELSKDNFSSALDEIHTNASRSDTLTTFDDFTSPSPGSKGEAHGFAEDIVHTGFSGLYNRLKASVGAARDAVAGSAGNANDSADDASIKSAKAKVAALKGSGSGTIASPTTTSTTSSSKIHSPLTARFPEPQVPSIQYPLPAAVIPVMSRPSKPTADTSPIANAQIKLYPLASDDSTFSPTAVNQRTATRQPEGFSSTITREQDAQGFPMTKSKSRPSGQSVLDHQPDATRSYRDADLASNLTNDSFITDPDQTPRKPTRFTSERPNLIVETSTRSPMKTYKQFSPSLDTQERSSLKSESLSEPYASPPRPPLIQVSQSHLPGFRASRTNSSDGEGSSVTHTATRSRRSGFDPVEEHGTNSSHGDADSSHTISRMRSKILAKELWMRDENAKDCFYCGDTFSAFRRKHHCRE
jgi:1-phosphatidylinositol-3-phosphate 5-kinase